MTEMKVGDVVSLASGSPKLTVVEVGDTSARVIWINYTTHAPHELTAPKEVFVTPPKRDPSAPPWAK